MSRFAVFERVSTHSRPKAAGRNIGQHRYERYRFNTQPPEGGWNAYPNKKTVSETFQHTAARRRLVCQLTISKDKQWFQHTAARRRLVITNIQERGSQLFQHTAARRRLGRRHNHQGRNQPRFNTQPPEGGWERLLAEPMAVVCVSTHSRPKAAGCRLGLFEVLPSCFNTQPPEGGWVNPLWNRKGINGFNTQPPEGGWRTRCRLLPPLYRFNTQPPEGGWR